MIDLRLAVTDQVVGDYPVLIKCREHNDKTPSWPSTLTISTASAVGST